MDKLNVLVISAYGALSEREFDAIAAVDPSRVTVKDARLDFLAELREKNIMDRYIEVLYEEEERLGRDPYAYKPKESFDKLLAETDILYAMGTVPTDLLKRMPRLKWVHLAETSVARFVGADWFSNDHGFVITNAVGATSQAIAEHCIGMMFALTKQHRKLNQIQKDKKWLKVPDSIQLAGKTMAVIGLGTIGSKIARMAQGIGMNVIATRRSATKREKNVFGVDEIYPAADLDEVISQCDVLAIAAPLTPETTGMVGAAQINKLKQGAYVLNVGRGAIIDQPVLVKALKEGKLGGVGLDVFDPEPLPLDNELWDMQNVIVSCHTAGSTLSQGQNFLDLFCGELKKFLADEPLQFALDIKRGY